MTVEAVLKDLKARKYAPVYVFHGDEPYYNEQLVKFMEENILNPDEKEFNFTVLYGADVSPEDVVVTARRFPMMAEYQVTIVKEAQAMKRPGPDVYQRMVSYIENPNPNTILVLFFRGVKVPKRAVSDTAKKRLLNQLRYFHRVRKRLLRLKSKSLFTMLPANM
jgi:DNA polymerase-3 subunit delta